VVNPWLDAKGRAEVGTVIGEIEARTAAEIVVTVRRRSASYRHVDLAVGAAFALIALLVYVYAPAEFDDNLAPLAIVSAFVAGALGTAAIDPWKRLLVGRRARSESVQRAARAAFYDQRIASTVSRKGILVYVSLFEREVAVLPDVGVSVPIEVSIKSFDEFVRTLKAAGEVLATEMPVTADDVNELPNEVAG
jgi:uncharacterized membrane protein